MADRDLTSEQTEELLATLEARFARNMRRHEGLSWPDVRARLTAEKLWSLNEMERTGGEPDVIGVDAGEYVFCDCSPESPAGRRSLCYDREALESRKENRPRSSAVDAAGEMGIELLSEERYRALQQFGEFDTKTSSWIATPPEVRVLGGALFGDRRYGRVFAYHNGAQSYYAARGFRGLLRV
ncbi:MAG: hypothetical protein BWY81_00726 [Firmicutes bacterium ADurb.Bin467]|nr:MAG: hypothetical protein BWY81_00726 [Firmicutes bacterium ADurb.Bin467]